MTARKAQVAADYGAHPDFVPFLERLVDRDGLTIADLPGERERMASAHPAPATDVEHEEHHVVVMGAGTVRIVESRPPDGLRSQARILWVHGGGYMLGTPEMDQRRMDTWAAGLGCAVFSPDYRLAPEHPHPAALSDCWAALKWLIDTGSVAEAGPIMVGGMSAGGGLAAALALKARDAESSLAGQFLLCPMLDDRWAQYPSSDLDVPGWTLRAKQLGWASYLGTEEMPTPADGYAVPGRAERLDALAPAFVAVGGLDVLRDEGIRYATRMMDAGVPVDLHAYDGAPHGFSAVAPEAATSRRMEAELTAFIERLLTG